MVKSIISILAAAALLIAGGFYEHVFIKREFGEFAQAAQTVYVKVEEQTAEEADVYALQDKWIAVKNQLHTFIPHNEIKEFDVLIAKAARLVGQQMWEEALSELEVVKELAEQIPRTYEISFANIF